MTPKVGQFVEIAQHGQWLPMLVTHVHSDTYISGVAFSGRPKEIGWGKPSGDFPNVPKGDGHRHWRFVKPSKPAKSK